ncbi:DUF1116 domain-containing protein [Oscillospiraceae bacterium MB08-C2-2]|nr:DUF1116 domain-containing protein [Oscillospiraceae bacterium MB08-C2-2]
MKIEEIIEQANQKVIDVMLQGRPVWVDVQPAGTVIPNMKKNTILVAGPPIAAENIVPPVRVTICGAAIHEGLAKTAEEAWEMVISGEIEIASGQDYSCACGAAMATSASMPVVVCEDKEFGGFGFCTPHPGNRQHVLRWGFYDDEIEKELVWFRDHYGPALGKTVRKAGGIDLKSILSKTAGMGDENHNRQPAASMAMALQMIPFMMDIETPQKDAIMKEFAANDRFFLHIMMAGVESVLASAKNVPMSTIMVGMGGNGVEFGLQFSGTGNEWFTVEAPKILGQFLNPAYTEDDILGFLGDSCVTEIYGLGGISAVAGPSYVRLTGGSFAEAKRRTDNARQICLGEHMFAPIPWDDFRGFPVGIDMRRVVGLNILPTSHGGSTLIAGGQGGAGSSELPLECFKKGLVALSKLVQERSTL